MPEGRAKRKLTAILSADVKGYSRLMGEDEFATVNTLKEYREVISSLVQQFSGRVVDSPGDNLLAQFGSVVDAVECAVEIQGTLEEQNSQLPEDRRMEFRIGVNLGDVIHDEGRIYGDGVNVAARVEGLAEGGGICISGTAFDQIGKKLSFGYEYLGEQEVKNIEKPVRVYRVLTTPEFAGKVIGEEKPKPGKWPRTAITAAVTLIIVAGAMAIWHFYFRPPPIEPASVERMAFPLPKKPSIAVLPFDNMSEDPKQEFLSDGMTEEIITALSKVPYLFVIARNSTFSYKGKLVKISQVAEKLGVQYVLEGSVRRAGDRVRITARLIDAIKGYHLWSERYDRDLKDIFALYDDITMKILVALEVKLTKGEQASIHHKVTGNLEAYLKDLQAVEYMNRLNREGNLLARQMAQEAVALDPEYARPYRVLATSYINDVVYGTSKSPKSAMERAYELAQKAISLDDSNPGGYELLSFIYLMKRQYDRSIAEAKRAIAFDPNGAEGRYRLGQALIYAGRPEEAFAPLEKALRINPIAPARYFLNLGRAYRNTGRYENAIGEFKKAINRAPESGPAHFGLAATYSLAGRDVEARAEVAEVLRINPTANLAGLKRLPYRNQADKKRIIDAMRKAGLPEKPPLPLPDKPSIAVLSFVNMSGDQKKENLGDGISEEIINALSKTPKLFVIARESSFSYKGKYVKVQQIARELGVRYILEGSVRRSEGRLRIVVQLIDGKSGHNLWTERYDREVKDIFSIQDEITMKVITALRVKLTAGEEARIHAKGTNNLKAHLKVLEAFGSITHPTRRGLVLARKLLEEAIALDPQYAEGYRLLGSTYMLEAMYGFSKSQRDSLATAIKLNQKAITMDDSNALAHIMLGFLFARSRKYEKAIKEGERAYELGPNFASVVWLYAAILNVVGRSQESLQLYKAAMRLMPIPTNNLLRGYAVALRDADRYEESIPLLKRALKQEPNDLMVHVNLTQCYWLLGREDEAFKAAAEVLRLNPKFSVVVYAKRLPLKNQEVKERCIDALRKAGLPDKPHETASEKPSIAVLPFKNMSGDPEQEYFVDGMTEDLITDLSKISGLFVIARNSAFRYKGKNIDVKKVGRDLGVKYLLEGSVRKVGDQVRITAQLIDTSTGGHLWAERYDGKGKLDDTFEMQDKISGKIVKALAVQLTASEEERVARKDTENVTAYDSFLKARAHYHKHTPEDFAKALSHFENAIETDPDYRRAYFFMALIYSKASKFGKRWLDPLDLSNALVAEGQAKKYLELSKCKIVFVTSERYTGNLGGVAGACEKCQKLAETAGLPGTYRAWLSDKTSSPSTTFTRWDGPYVLVDGTEVASKWEGLIGEFHSVPIKITETGQDAGESLVWTNTSASGVPGPGPRSEEETWAGGDPRAPIRDGSCQNWTSSNGDLYDGCYGNTIANIGIFWTMWVRGGTAQSADCDEMLRLYCFQQ